MKASKKQSWLADRQYVGKPVGQRGSWFATVKWEDGESSHSWGNGDRRRPRGHYFKPPYSGALCFNILSSFLLFFLLFCCSIIMSSSEPDANAQTQENWPPTLQNRRVSVTWAR
jgi:hypothetical protein